MINSIEHKDRSVIGSHEFHFWWMSIYDDKSTLIEWSLNNKKGELREKCQNWDIFFFFDLMRKCFPSKCVEQSFSNDRSHKIYLMSNGNSIIFFWKRKRKREKKKKKKWTVVYSLVYRRSFWFWLWNTQRFSVALMSSLCVRVNII